MVASPARPQRLLRFAGLFAWALIGVQTFADVEQLRAPQVPGWIAWLALAVGIALHVAFGAAFWANTRLRSVPRGRAPWVLLGLQVALALLLSTDLLILVAAQVPLALTPRAASLWLAVQLALTLAVAAALAPGDSFELAAGLAALPRPVAVVLTVTVLVAWQLFAFGGGFLAASEARGRLELARVHAELAATQEMLAASSRLAERLHIARELHDTLGHHLTVLSVHLELARRLGAGPASDAIADASGVTRLLLGEVREVVGTLRGERTVDLRSALAALARATASPCVHLDHPQDLEIADPAQAHALFRCGQEAITNAVRHSRARNLWLALRRRDDGAIELAAHDDGRGAASVVEGDGLRGMRERVEALGGSLRVDSAVGAGTRLRASLPAAVAS